MGRGSLNGEKCASTSSSANSRARGQNTGLAADSILYGQLQPGALSIHGGNLVAPPWWDHDRPNWWPDAQDFSLTGDKADADYYWMIGFINFLDLSGRFYDLQGYSGGKDWLVETPGFPANWQNHYKLLDRARQRENVEAAREFLDSIKDQGYTVDSRQTFPCDFIVDDQQGNLYPVSTDDGSRFMHHSGALTVPQKAKLATIEGLSPSEGHWAIVVRPLPESGKYVYLNDEKKVLGCCSVSPPIIES